MRGLIQRVSCAHVSVEQKTVGAIDTGIVLLLGVQQDYSRQQADKLLHKVMNYRIFNDAENKMNLSLQQTGGGLLIISQFTLAAETQKGLRPGFSTAAAPDDARILYDYFVAQAHLSTGVDHTIATGIFAADMQVSLVNDGPVTFLLEA